MIGDKLIVDEKKSVFPDDSKLLALFAIFGLSKLLVNEHNQGLSNAILQHKGDFCNLLFDVGK